MWLKSRKPELYTGNPDSSQCPSHHQHTWVKKGPYHFVDFPGGSEVKNLLTNAEATETQVWSLGQEDLLENEVDTHSSILAWRIPWTWEPGRPPSMGPQKVGHDWVTVPAGWWVFFPAHHFIYFIKRLLSLVLESSYKWQKIKELEMENHPCHCGLSRIIVSTWDYLKGVPGKIWISDEGFETFSGRGPPAEVREGALPSNPRAGSDAGSLEAGVTENQRNGDVRLTSEYQVLTLHFPT